MNIENVFVTATREKFRFKVANGMVTVEDLWSLPLPQLDNVARGLRRELRDIEDSFIESRKKDTQLEMKFEVVKFIIDTKLAEREAATEAKNRIAQRKVLQEALEKKQNEAISNMSEEDIKKALAALENQQ